MGPAENTSDETATDSPSASSGGFAGPNVGPAAPSEPLVQHYADFLNLERPVNLCNYYHFPNGFSVDEVERIVELGMAHDAHAGVAGGAINPVVRRSNVSWLALDHDTRWIFERLGRYANEANHAMWNFNIAAMTEKLQFTEYYAAVEGHYDWHMDLGTSESRRKISMVVQLTDPLEYEGGELQLNFGGGPRTVERRQGHVTAFPSFALHRVTPVTVGRRHSLVVWVSGEPFR